MSQTTLNRRQLLKILTLAGSAGAAIPTHALFEWFGESQSNEHWLSAHGHKDNEYRVGVVNATASATQNLLSGFRGHGVAQNPVKRDQAILVGRRPRKEALIVNPFEPSIVTRIHCRKNQHMQGHACYSKDGEYLYTAESNYHSGQGLITVRDTTHFNVINQFQSHGIGPHEIGFMPDGKTLAVANGGLLTHPDTGRKVLNLSTMRSTLSFIDARSGDLINEHTVSEPKASIRHLDIAQDGTVAVALQVQRDAMSSNDLVPLAAVLEPQRGNLGLMELIAPKLLTQKLNDYMGSVCIHAPSKTAAFSSPKGDIVMFWDLNTHEHLGQHMFYDVCGLTLSHDQQYFVLSNSAGKIRRVSTQTLKEDKSLRMYFPNIKWDNHMITLQSAV